MGKVEEDFAAGGAAFRAGEPRDTSQPFNWVCGWDSALASKKVAFSSYIKDRTLHDQQYMPPNWPRDQLRVVQSGREKRIVRLEAEFPDFPEAYKNFKAAR